MQEMGKEELVETFEAARKAANNAAGGGAAVAELCVDALRRLRKIPVTTQDLVETQVGKHLRGLTKHSEETIRNVASDLLQYWKKVVLHETSKGTAQNKFTQGNKSPKAAEKKISNAAMHVRSESRKVEISNGIVTKAEMSKCEFMQIAKSDSGRVEKISAEKLKVENNVFNTNGRPSAALKLGAVTKCNNPVRDKYREILVEAFCRVPTETTKSEREEVRNISAEVNACDPFRVAVTLESILFDKLGPPTGAHKQKYRSIMFNLKDGNNTDFRRSVLLGHVPPAKIVDMTPEEMASDERKRENEQIKERALFECERAGAPKATTDQFKCGRCGQRKTTYYQLQTRSADEPMTTFVTCVNCNNHWKFC